MITYEKLFIVLEKKGYNKAWLRKNGLNANTVNQLVKNQSITMIVLNRLCNLLDCEPQDILTFKKDTVTEGEESERPHTS